jgi:hypothetical protein
LKFLEDCGMRITTLPEAFSKIKIGVKLGLANLVTVFFGMYSAKLVNIPL